MKTKSIKALMVALAITALSLLGTAPGANAIDPGASDDVDWIGPDVVQTEFDSLGDAVITKLVTVPRGELPDSETLTFTFTQDTNVNDATTTQFALTPNTVTGNVTENQTKLEDSVVADLNVGNWDVYRLDVPFGDLISGTQFPHGGMYAYRITETPGSIDTTTYSQAEYLLCVYVVNGDAGPKVQTITVETSKDQTGTDIPDKTKINPVPSDTALSGFIFINQDSTAGDSLERPLTISKRVTTDGELDAADRTKQFTFELTLTTPSPTTPIATYLGKISNKNAVATDPTTDVTFTDRAVQTFKLTHDQVLKFDNLPAGTTYTLTEIGEERYQAEASFSTQENAKTARSSSVEQQDEGDPLTIAWAASGDNAIVGSGTGNSVEVTNTMTQVSITGIVIDNLPFVLMMLIPVGAAVAFLVARRRRA